MMDNNSGSFPFFDKGKYLITGPCSVESRSQLLEAGDYLSGVSGVAIFRAGIWKPRSRPSGFEGIGSQALSWLMEVRSRTGLPVATEVARSAHVQMALEAGVDMVWLGARTVVNPFSVQEVADALSAHPVPVLIKNPVTPDLNLWCGALERMLNAGAPAVAAIHRGFYSFHKSPFRNDPMWEVPIELKRRFPGVPLICDPSHICGNTNTIPEISQKALDLEMDGLMLEVHPNPAQALTDAHQQLSFPQLDKLIEGLVVRNREAKKPQEQQLTLLREAIDKTDQKLLETLGERMEAIRKIGIYKKTHNITILQENRFREMISNRLQQAESHNLDRHFLLKLLQQVHKESVRIQQDILNR